MVTYEIILVLYLYYKYIRIWSGYTKIMFYYAVKNYWNLMWTYRVQNKLHISSPIMQKKEFAQIWCGQTKYKTNCTSLPPLCKKRGCTNLHQPFPGPLQLPTVLPLILTSNTVNKNVIKIRAGSIKYSDDIATR